MRDKAWIAEERRLWDQMTGRQARARMIPLHSLAEKPRKAAETENEKRRKAQLTAEWRALADWVKH